MKAIYLSIIVFSFFRLPGLSAQEMRPSILSSAGSHSENSGIYLQWTLGELLTNEYQQNDVMLGEGFHWGSQNQDESGTSTIINEEFANISVVPNPAANFIRIIEPETSHYTFRYYIFSSAFPNLLTGNSQAGTNISVQSLPPGFYYISIVYPDERQYHQRFVLVK